MIKKIVKDILKRLKNYILHLNKGDIANQVVNTGESGYVYIVTGEGYAKECVFSILSLRKHTDKKICVFSEERFRVLFSEHCDYFYVVNSKVKRPKIEYMGQTPFERSVYLDSDTFVRSSLDDLFDVLDRFEFCASFCHSRKRDKYSKKIKRYSDIPYSFSEVNSGVVSYRMTRSVVELFKSWKKNYFEFINETDGWDQPSLRVSLWESDVKAFVLPPEYNVRPMKIAKKIRDMRHELGENHMQPRIYHMHYSPDVHSGKFEVESLEELESIMEKEAIELNY